MTRYNDYSSDLSSSDYSSSDESSSEEQIKPIVKWVGGKMKIMDKVINNIPEKFNDYYEPFLGGASVFLNMPFEKKAIINDYNLDLTNLYKIIKERPEELIKELKIYQNKYNNLKSLELKKKYFIDNRKKFNNLKGKKDDKSLLHRAALYVFINKTGFNGFMQFNKDNICTSSFGQHNKLNIYNKDNIYNFSDLLSKNVTIKNGDYAKAIATAKKRDFVYLDSPYIPDDKTQCTINYNAGSGWSYDDFMRYFDVLDELDKKGVYFMMSNSDSKLVRKWLKNKKYKVKKIPIMRSVARTSGTRGLKKEVIVMNY